VQPKKPVCHTHELATRRTIMQFSHFNKNSCGRNASQHYHFILKISTKWCQTFKNWLSFFIFFLLTFIKVWKLSKHYPIALKFDIPLGKIKAHPDTKLGCNTINGHKVIKDYSQKITPICCHTYRVNLGC